MSENSHTVPPLIRLACLFQPSVRGGRKERRKDRGRIKRKRQESREKEKREEYTIIMLNAMLCLPGVRIGV